MGDRSDMVIKLIVPAFMFTTNVWYGANADQSRLQTSARFSLAGINWLDFIALDVTCLWFRLGL